MTLVSRKGMGSGQTFITPIRFFMKIMELPVRHKEHSFGQKMSDDASVSLNEAS
jgi:hypothetical protein